MSQLMRGLRGRSYITYALRGKGIGFRRFFLGMPMKKGVSTECLLMHTHILEGRREGEREGVIFGSIYKSTKQGVGSSFVHTYREFNKMYTV